jgi:pentatricopeptide repeat protein
VLSKCGDESAPAKALELMDDMKSRQINADVFTYTSAINVMAKAESVMWSNKAEELLDQIIQEQERTGRSDLKPNVRTFTSVINAVARSKEHPERALAMLERMRQVGVQPDSICYNAVINAYGWSNVVGKEESAFELLQEMLRPDSKVKPDIITANSILHSCAFAVTESEAQRGKVMEYAIQTLEIFTRDAPSYGWPDHITYANMLLTIAKQMPLNEKRVSLAEATFWKCCEVGHVSSLVVQRLRLAIPADRLAAILGSAMLKNTEKSFIFDMKELPAEWKIYAPSPGRHKASRASEKKEEQLTTKGKKRGL